MNEPYFILVEQKSKLEIYRKEFSTRFNKVIYKYFSSVNNKEEGLIKVDSLNKEELETLTSIEHNYRKII